MTKNYHFIVMPFYRYKGCQTCSCDTSLTNNSSQAHDYIFRYLTTEKNVLYFTPSKNESETFFDFIIQYILAYSHDHNTINPGQRRLESNFLTHYSHKSVKRI